MTLPLLTYACPVCGRWAEVPVRELAQDVIEIPTPLCARHRSPLHMRLVDPVVLDAPQ